MEEEEKEQSYLDPLAKINQVEIRVGPSQFGSAARRVHRVPAKGVVGRLNSKKEYNKLRLLNKKKAMKDNAHIILIKQGKSHSGAMNDRLKVLFLFLIFITGSLVSSFILVGVGSGSNACKRGAWGLNADVRIDVKNKL